MHSTVILLAVAVGYAAAQCSGSSDHPSCASWIKSSNFCANTFYNDDYKKKNCGYACGLCPSPKDSLGPAIGGKCNDPSTINIGGNCYISTGPAIGGLCPGASKNYGGLCIASGGSSPSGPCAASLQAGPCISGQCPGGYRCMSEVCCP